MKKINLLLSLSAGYRVISTKHPVDLLTTDGTSAVRDVLLYILALGTLVVMGVDQQRVALWAECLVDMGTVAGVDVRDAALPGCLQHLVEERFAGRLAVFHPVTGEEPGQVPHLHSPVGEFLAQLRDHPLRVDPLDDQRRDLLVEPRFGDRLNVVQHRLEIGMADGPVVGFVSFHVDVERVDDGEDPLSGLGAETPVGHHDVAPSVLMDQRGHGDHIVLPDGRLAVGVADRLGVGLLGEAHHLLRRNVLCRPGKPFLGYLVVLAEITGVVAARLGERQALGAGKKMVQRLFLDGIQRQADQLAVVRGNKLPPVVPAYPAEPGPTVGDVAVAVAEITGLGHSENTSAVNVSKRASGMV